MIPNRRDDQTNNLISTIKSEITAYPRRYIGQSKRQDYLIKDRNKHQWRVVENVTSPISRKRNI